MNPYDILGVTETATQDEIKSAWRKLATKYHPDVNPDNPDAVSKLQEINQAYELVKTAEKRSSFDRQRANNGNFHHGFDNADFMYQHFTDLFKKSQSVKSYNMNVELTIDEINTGKRITSQIILDGETIDIDFAIPAGVPDFSRFNIKQIKSKTGLDVVISATVVTRQEPLKQRHGDDILILETISAFDAMLGTEIEIEPLAGQRLNLKIPKGTQPDTKLILRSAGLPIFNSQARGNIIAIIKVTIPTNLTDEQLDIVSGLR